MGYYEKVKSNEEVNIYLKKADEALKALGYTDHGSAHCTLVAERAGYLLKILGYTEKEIDLVKVAAYLHDIGNITNRDSHSQSGGLISFYLLNKIGLPPEDIATVVTAIGNHDEDTGTPVNAVAAALIIADKSDVRRSRVRKQDFSKADIHDRVNYSVIDTCLKVSEDKNIITLTLCVDTKYGSVMDYFEIFLKRMLLSRKASEMLGAEFKLVINGQTLI